MNLQWDMDPFKFANPSTVFGSIPYQFWEQHL